MGTLGVALDRWARRSGRAFLLLFALSLAVEGFLLTWIDPSAVRPDTRWEAPLRAPRSPPDLPLIYYVVAYMPRYREPMDRILMILAAAAFTGGFGRAPDRGRPRVMT
jgi:hypothetical protein